MIQDTIMLHSKHIISPRWHKMSSGQTSPAHQPEASPCSVASESDVIVDCQSNRGREVSQEKES